MKKTVKRFWSLFLIFSMLLAYVPDGIVLAADTLKETDKIEAPISFTEPGIYAEAQGTLLSTSTSGATIYYTLDGTMPTLESSQFKGFIMIPGSAGQSVTTTITAIAVATVDGELMRSAVAEFEYTIQMGSTVTLIWEDLLTPENITGTQFTDDDGKVKYEKVWNIAYGESFEELKFFPKDKEEYYFPEGYGSVSSNGINVKRVDSESIKVYGIPTGNVKIVLVTPSVIVDPDESESSSGSEGSGGSENPGSSEKPGDSEKPGSSENPGDSENPGSSENPGDSENPGSSENPGDSENPDEDDNGLYFGSYPSEIQYGDTVTIVAAGGYGSGKVRYESSNTNVATVDSKGKVTIVGIGEFSIKATKEASDGVKAHSITTNVIKAVKRKLTVDNIVVESRPYDGTDKVTVTGGTLVGIFGDDVVKLVASSTEGTLETVSAGTDKPLKTLPTYSIEGTNIDADKYYELVQPSAKDYKVTISKMELTLVDFAVSEKNYDGTTKATISNKGKLDTTNLTDTLKAQVAKLSVAYTDAAVSFESANVARDNGGAVIPAKVKVDATQFALVGEGAENFTVAPFECSATIKPLALNVYVEKVEYENATKLLANTVYENFDVTAEGLLEGETLSLPKVKVMEEIVVELGEKEYANAIQYVDANYGPNYDVTENTTLTIVGTTPPLNVETDLAFYVDGKKLIINQIPGEKNTLLNQLKKEILFHLMGWNGLVLIILAIL